MLMKASLANDRVILESLIQNSLKWKRFGGYKLDLELLSVCFERYRIYKVILVLKWIYSSYMLANLQLKFTVKRKQQRHKEIHNDLTTIANSLQLPEANKWNHYTAHNTNCIELPTKQIRRPWYLTLPSSVYSSNPVNIELLKTVMMLRWIHR